MVQTSALEIVWRRIVIGERSISGTHVLPYSSPRDESFTIDTEADWQEAERRVAALQLTDA